MTLSWLGKLAPYGRPQYWENRYQSASTAETYDWYVPYPGALRHLVQSRCDPAQPVLMIGCGNSTMSEEMAVDGFMRIDNIDCSQSVIAAMNARRPKALRDNLHYQVADVRRLDFADASYAQLIDKGTYDAVAQGGLLAGQQMLAECARVLRPGGVLLIVSYAPPFYRASAFEEAFAGWEIHCQPLTEHPMRDYGYVMVKPRGAPTRVHGP